MARKKSLTLTEAELRLMDILWEKGQATVSEVAEALPQKLGLAYNTVLTTLRILEQKGYLAHREAGRAFVYHPIVDRQAASRSAVSQVLRGFFGNSAGALALNLVENERLDSSELARLKKLISDNEAAAK